MPDLPKNVRDWLERLCLVYNRIDLAKQIAMMPNDRVIHYYNVRPGDLA